MKRIIRENRLRKLCMELERQGKILICTLANGVSKSYPANYQSVIGVKGFILEDEKSFWFNRKKHIQAVVDNNPYLLRNEQQQYQLFGKCNSFSTAKFSGIVSKIMQKNDIGDKHEIEDILEKNSRRNKWCKKHFIASKRFPEFKPRNDYNYMLVHRIAWLIMEYLHLNGTDVLYEHSLFDSHIGLNYTNAFGLLQKIEQEINIKIIDYTKISRYDFYSVYTLVSLVEKYLGEIR